MAKGRAKATLKPKAVLREPAAKKELDLIVYWTTLLVLATANLFAAIMMAPLLLLAESVHIYLIIAIMAMLFGYVFSILVTRIENLDIHHHVLAVLLIPAFALISLIAISSSTEGIAALLGIESDKNPLVIRVFYTAFFVLPHILHVSKEKIIR